MSGGGFGRAILRKEGTYWTNAGMHVVKVTSS